MKFKKLIALAIAALTITMAFAPNALAATWNFTLQSTESYTTYGSCAVNRYMKQHFRGMSSFDSDYSYYVDLTSNDSASGIFSYSTYKVVTKFRSKENISVDGAVGSVTWGRMGSHVAQASGGGGDTQSIPAVITNVDSPYALTTYYYVKSYYTGYTDFSEVFSKTANMWAVRRSLANDTYYHFS